MLDRTHLGLVAYAKVNADGSVNCSSGLTVVRTGVGNYNIYSLADAAGSPADPANQVPIFDPSDLAFATSHVLAPFFPVAVIQTASLLQVYCYAGPSGGAVDIPFSLVVQRPLIP
jgi:hypothetical protein